MTSKYDTEPLKVTPRYTEALKQLMWAKMEMMRLHDPAMADCWTWGVCTVGDLATPGGLHFEYGADEDKPTDFPECTDVWVKLTDTDN